MWLVVPSTSSPSALASGDWSWDSSESFEKLASSAGLSGTSTGLKSLQSAWKKHAWIRRLCGRICIPSTAERGVGLWIASLQATRASRSASRAGEAGRITPSISGLSASGSSESPVPSGSSSRTSPDICPSDLTRSPETYRAWASGLRQDSSRRLKQVALTRGFGSTRSAGELWATPTRRDWKDGSNPSAKAPTKSLLGRQAPRSGIGGELYSRKLRSSLRLSPWFEEWLMGFPHGWTALRP